MHSTYQRSARVSDLLKEEISLLLLREVKDPNVGFITITDVEVSKDMRFAWVYYTVLGNETQLKVSAVALQRASHFIKRQLGRRMRIIPDITFKYDQSLAYAERIEHILNHLHCSGMSKINDE